MPLPEDVPTFTLIAEFPPLSPGGVERSGALSFTPVPPVLAEASGVYLGVENATLNATGGMTVDLVANDAFDTPFVWRVDGRITGQPPFSTNISIPASAGTVHLGAVAGFEALSPDYVVVVGPQGPEGPAGSGGGGGSPSGPAGGALTGEYPNPTLSTATIAAFDAAGSAADAQTAATSTAAADATAKVSAHVSASDPHGDRAAAATALSSHVGAADPHGDRAAAAADATSKVTAHVGASDPHGDRAAAATDAASKVTAHSGAADPHGDRAFTASAVSTHTAAADPHGDRAAAATDAASKVATHAGASDPHGDRAFTTSGISTHAAAADPHGDRADAAAKYLPLTGGAVSGNLTVAGHALRTPQAADHGLRAWTFDPRFCGATAAVATSGTLFLSALFITESFTATTLYWGVSVAPTSQVAGQNFVGLYDSGGNLLTSVGVDSDTATTGLKTATINVALTVGTYWVGFLFNATTAPQLPRAAGAGGTPTLINVGLSGAGQLYATNGTGRTSMPSSIAMSSNAAATGYWAAIK